MNKIYWLIFFAFITCCLMLYSANYLYKRKGSRVYLVFQILGLFLLVMLLLLTLLLWLVTTAE